MIKQLIHLLYQLALSTLQNTLEESTNIADWSRVYLKVRQEMVFRHENHLPKITTTKAIVTTKALMDKGIVLLVPLVEF